MTELPYGSWPTPITSELVVRSARLPGAVHVDGDEVWWSEGRPEEAGRITVLRRHADGAVDEVLPPEHNARTAVHEYGGGAWWVSGGVLWFADWATQRLHRLEPGGEPVALTPEPEVPRGLRYADGDVHPGGTTLLCVQERHPAEGGEAVNTIVQLAAHQPVEPQIVVEGADFVSNPRWSPDGASFCWLEWDHPDMPWDATRLVLDEGGRRTVVAGGDERESIGQPEWAPDGSLWFYGDRTGFWSLYRWTRDRGRELVVDLQKDIGVPQWVFGQSSYVLLDDGRVAFAFSDGGLDRLAVREPAGGVATVDLPLTMFDSLRARGNRVVGIAAGPSTEPHVVEIDVDAAAADVLVAPRDLGLEDAWFPPPEPISFPTAGGHTAHALLYRPANPGMVAPEGERPPLLVMIHGGPTSAARPMLQVSRHYWTSRGFAVVDVNYRGSTGYGRAYRELLRGQWGVADVEDCAAVCTYLGERGDVDPARLCIRGGSAGGFTTLAALAFHDVFAAGASHYGVADLAVLAEETHKFESHYLDGLVAPLPEGRAAYDERSPIFHLDRFDRPLAVFQGLDDPVVPPNQAEMIVDALRWRGVPVAYLAFEGEQHGFRQSHNIRAALDGELSFYAQVLGFDLPPDEDITPIEVSRRL
ncbi:MAG: S9 family peptidase [Acidimicrobiales bacterium]